MRAVSQLKNAQRKPLDAAAYAAMLLLAALWGFQQAAIKLVAADVSLLMQAAIRSAAATLLVLGWAAWRGIPLFARDGTLRAGLGAGLLFGAEFALIYAGLAHTNVSRMTVFVYLAPPLTALGVHFFVPGERLAALQWGGVLVAFAGLVLAFAEGFGAGRSTWIGDLCGVAIGLAGAAGFDAAAPAGAIVAVNPSADTTATNTTNPALRRRSPMESPFPPGQPRATGSTPATVQSGSAGPARGLVGVHAVIRLGDGRAERGAGRCEPGSHRRADVDAAFEGRCRLERRAQVRHHRIDRRG